MGNDIKTDKTYIKNKAVFYNELKLFVNKKLFEKSVISEDAYINAKEFLTKEAV